MVLAISYVGAEFPQILAQPDVEYQQANLTIACTSWPVVNGK